VAPARDPQISLLNLPEEIMSAKESAKSAVGPLRPAAEDHAGDCNGFGKEKQYVQVHSSTVRFAGDSGDGMQVVGSQFADIASMTGLAVCTQPDYPSEIRAPAGSLGGVSGFQLSFADHALHTPGDSPYVLVAMNPAALKVNLRDVQPGGILIVNEDEFTEANLTKACYPANPLTTDELAAYRVIPVPMTRMNEEAVRHSNLPRKDAARCKNFFALGLSLWLYDRPIQPVLEFLIKKFRKNLPVMEANGASLRAGYNYADTAELFRVQHTVAAAKLPKGRYRRLTGNEAAALGLVAAANKAGRTLVYASYPITPASEILHELSKYKDYDVRTLQVEDEIAACVATIGASFAGAIAVTGTSGPGLALKTEGLGLAVMTELPMVVIDVQRAGPSTGMPTKTEQSDLFMAVHGRHGEAPLPVLAAATPADCFAMVFEAVRLATKYMTPVMVLSDSFLANGAEPWRIVEPEDLPDLRTPALPTSEKFAPYRRDPHTLARPWIAPGTPGYEHRVGGLEKADVTGAVSYDAANHRRMTVLRAEKIERIAHDIPPAAVSGTGKAELLVVSWGSTFGSVAAAVDNLQHEGRSVDHLHLRYLNPFPANLGEVLKKYMRIIVPENNMGQLCTLLRAKYLVDARPLPKVEGRPFRVNELVEQIGNIL
jgi:2-oxoglutarate ferredoxin oxidoreductase subunit alpha